MDNPKIHSFRSKLLSSDSYVIAHEAYPTKPRGTHLARCEKVPCGTLYKCPGYYCLPLFLVCDGFWDCPKGTDEAFCLKRNCHGMFACSNSSICIHMTSVCNSITECPGHDDEVYCDLSPCPEDCECLGYMIHCNNASELPVLYSKKIITYFVISVIFSNVKTHLLQFRYMKNLKFLDLRGNAIKQVFSKG